MEGKAETTQVWTTELGDLVGGRSKSEKSVAAFTIQSWWRQRVIQRALSRKLLSNAKKLVVFTSTISADGGVGLRTKSVLNGCQAAGVKPLVVDLVSLARSLTSVTVLTSPKRDTFVQFQATSRDDWNLLYRRRARLLICVF